jgi:hypothetical protein
MLDVGMIFVQTVHYGGTERGRRASMDRKILIKDLSGKGLRRFGRAWMSLPDGLRD